MTNSNFHSGQGVTRGPVGETTRDLSPARRRLVNWMQRFQFGRIEGLRIVGGEPQFDPPPRLVREHKFGGDNGPNRHAGALHFRLREQLVDLFTYFDQVGDGTIQVLEVKYGLPFRMLVAEEGDASVA